MNIMKEPKDAVSYREEHELMMRVIFGDKELGELGMKEKIDEVHSILTQIKGVSGFFTGVGTWLKWFLVIAGVIGIIKGWWVAAIASVGASLTIK